MTEAFFNANTNIMSYLKTFSYRGQDIGFDFSESNKMINATQMAKAFSKKVGHFLALNSTRKYLSVLEFRYRNHDNGKIVHIVKGGTPSEQGTWMHHKLALRFAQWLSPEFSLWVDDRIEELLTTGSTTIKPLSPAEILFQQAKFMIQQEQTNKQFDQRISVIEAKQTTRDIQYFTISGYAALKSWRVPLFQAIQLGKKASALSRDNQYRIGKEYDAKYGQINSYHTDILERVFSKFFEDEKKLSLIREIEQLTAQIIGLRDQRKKLRMV